MENSPSNSRTWSVYLRNLAIKYDITDPLVLMQEKPMSKASYKKLVNDQITKFWVTELKLKSQTKNMKYFNVTNLTLSGRPHPAIEGACTTTLAKELRPAVKMRRRRRREDRGASSELENNLGLIQG